MSNEPREEWIGDLWPRQFREEMEKRLKHARDVARSAKRASFKEAAERMVRIYEATLTVIQLDGDVPTAFTVMAADRLAGEVCNLVDDHTLDPRSGAGDALLDYASTRHGDGDPIGNVRARAEELREMIGREPR